MKVDMKVNVDAAKILKSMGLGESKEAQRFLAGEVARLCDPYVPFADGTLKNGVIVEDDRIIYSAPYAHYQYVGEVMGPNIPLADGGFFSKGPKQYTGREIDYHDDGSGKRGKEWDKRMMADRGAEVEQALATYLASRRR